MQRLTRTLLPLGRHVMSRKGTHVAMFGTAATHSPSESTYTPHMPLPKTGFGVDKTSQLDGIKFPKGVPPPPKEDVRGDLGKTMPPGFHAHVADLGTFQLPERVTGSAGDIVLGKAIIDSWRSEGIIQIKMSDKHEQLWEDAKRASQAFFKKPHAEKAACVDSQSYAGYIASGEEVTDGVADYSEIFTVTKDLDLAERRVRARWPCHGPCPWPDVDFKEPVVRYNESLGLEGEKLLALAELGLGVTPGSLTKYTQDGWHHTRVLR